ncbi:MAG: hypothetical protein QGH76_04785 [Phycisphaerales bacterium]|nr:hypothetical protein [Phycisphaerales bacterium]
MRVRAMLLLAAVVGACAAPPTVRDPLAVAPADFSLDVTVVTQEPHTLAHMRSSRYVVFPDGSLHHGDEPGWGPNTLPPLTRRLVREQVANIWTYLDRMGMAGPQRADPTVNFQVLPRPDSGSLYMIAVTGEGKYWNFVRRIAADAEPDPAFTELIRLLAGYAWATDQPDIEFFEEPIRHDLGPDPYARYEAGEVP